MLSRQTEKSLRFQLVLLFCVAIVLHLFIPITFWLIEVPHEELWATVITFCFCATVMSIALTLVNRTVRRVDEITMLSLNFGRNPDRQQRRIPEEGSTEVRRAAQAFNSMRKQIQNLLHERDDMFTAFAHDIRTPLARIQMSSELISDEALRERIQANIREISSMLEKGMSLTKSGLSAEEPCPIDLTAFIENLVEEISQSSSQVVCAGCADIRERICVKARPSGIEICLRNLISNAINYGKGRVEVTVSSTQDTAFVDVVDNGPGIPDCCMERVMQPFFRVEASRNKESGGLGLGLSIAQNAARLDNGEIRLCNLKEGGMRARISFPRHWLPE
jgi:signal transduction histidine kinase